MILEPGQHRAASSSFFKHFSLTPAGSVREFLEMLMESYTLIPYENLSKIIKRGSAGSEHERLRLPGEVLDDYIERGLGGTCFSLSFYLMSILHNSGLDSYICMAHMGRRKNVHCITVVSTVKGKFLLDPGYLIHVPVPMKQESPVFLETDHACVRLTYHHGSRSFDLFSGSRSTLKWRYRFIDTPVDGIDFLKYWQASFGMQALNNICLTFRRGDRLVYIHGDYFRETGIDGFTTRRVRENLRGTIQEVSGVNGWVIEEALGAMRAYRQRRGL